MPKEKRYHLTSSDLQKHEASFGGMESLRKAEGVLAHLLLQGSCLNCLTRPGEGRTMQRKTGGQIRIQSPDKKQRIAEGADKAANPGCGSARAHSHHFKAAYLCSDHTVQVGLISSQIQSNKSLTNPTYIPLDPKTNINSSNDFFLLIVLHC